MLTILGCILVGILALLGAVLVLVINTEIFIHGQYCYSAKHYVASGEVRLFRRFILYRRLFTESEAATLVHEVADQALADVPHCVAAKVREPIRAPATQADERPAVERAISPEPSYHASPVADSTIVAPSVEHAAAQDGVHTAACETRREKLLRITRSELYNHPGRNVLLLLALLMDIKCLIAYLVKSVLGAFKIHKLHVLCVYGAEDPYHTGQAAAAVYAAINSISCLRDNRAVQINFVPEFSTETFMFDADGIILIKATTAVMKIVSALLYAILKGVIYYGGKITWRLGPNYFRKPKESYNN